jgi:hypothetical protein
MTRSFAQGSRSLRPATSPRVLVSQRVAGASPLANDEIEQRILAPFDSLGHTISFGLRATENRTRGCLIPDLVAVRLVNERDSSLVQTWDPMGTGALLTLEMNGQPGRRERVFSPARTLEDGVVFVVLPRP